jgi:hypothetical protein
MVDLLIGSGCCSAPPPSDPEMIGAELVAVGIAKIGEIGSGFL